MVKSKIDYEIETINNTDFLLILNMGFGDIILNQIYNGISKVKYGQLPKVNPVSKMDLPQRYYTYLKFYIKGTIKDISKETELEGYKIVDYNVKKGEFIKTGDKWNFKIYLSGMYSKI